MFSLIRMLPIATSLKTAEQLEAEIEQRKNAEHQLQLNNKMLTEAQIWRSRHWQWDIVNNKVTWSESTLKIFGMAADKKEMSYERYSRGCILRKGA